MNPKKKWMGSGIEEFVTQEMKDPAFRIAFSEARTKRIKKALGEMIRKARESQGLSQAALSKRARTTQAVISRIENLNTPYLPSVGVLARLAGALGAHIEITFIPGERAISSKDRLRVSSGT